MQTEQLLRQDLADLYAVLSYFKWDDLIYTHASIRIPDSNSFLINQFGLMFDEITADNLLKIDIDNANGTNINPAGFNIHNAIYKARSGISCIIHTHTNAGIAVSANRLGLLPISQQANSVLQSLSYHDYHGLFVEPMDEQILQKDLGNSNHMILRNHGLLTVGNTMINAFFNMYNLQKACEIQVLTNTNDCVYISDAAVKETAGRIEKYNQGQPHRPLAWKALLRKINNV